MNKHHMSYTEHGIREIIVTAIRQAESPGTSTGGSGHLSETGLKLDHYETLVKNQGLNITAYYTVEILSEFGAYPENPGQRYRYQRTFLLTPDGRIRSISERETYTLGALPALVAWPLVQEEINRVLGLKLDRIEWDYGENRAPFEFPPVYHMTPPGNEDSEPAIYRCRLEEEPGKPIARVDVQGHPAGLIAELGALMESLFGWKGLFIDDDPY